MSGSQPPLLPDATRALARFAAQTRDRDIPDEVVERIKLSFIDGMQCFLRLYFNYDFIFDDKISAKTAAPESRTAACRIPLTPARYSLMAG